ncbi:hypothetical protein A0H81_01382 [Grifola frondosa]|uniref:Aminoglycoside phosphotransferase domain-containing protein n=1 Tax=Grifola frondosa TaxID=5627 RepID=A0A1C7MT45_GRIFR|nr:hypothetical protein A0H81_01382 [Grifola frondosa]
MLVQSRDEMIQPAPVSIAPLKAGATKPRKIPLSDIVIDEALIPNKPTQWFDNWRDPRPLPTTAQVRAALEIGHGGTAKVSHFPDLKLVVKFGRSERVPISEGQALWILRQYTNIPVPTVYGWCIDDTETFIYMERIEGETLTTRWRGLKPDQKLSVLAQLAEIVSTLRHVKPKGKTYVGSLCREPIKDQVWLNVPGPAPGPLNTTAEFNDTFWRLADSLPGFPDHSYFVDVRRALPDNAPINLTHTDIYPDNILVSFDPERPKIVGVVDWSECGWYPDYWEYVKAGSPEFNSDWDDCLPIWLGNYQTQKDAYEAYEVTGY